MKNPLSASAPSRLRRHLTSGLVALGIAVGMVAATPTRADAASFVIGCFLPARATTPAHSLEGMPVEIRAWHNGQEYYVKTVYLGANHCASWDVPANLQGYYLRVYMDFRVTSATYQLRWRGESPWWGLPGQGRYSLGVNPANCVTGCFMY